MDIATGAASSAASDVSKFLWNIGAQHIGYLIFYNKNINNLTDQVKKLEPRKNAIQEEVDVAKREGDIIRQDVEQWLTSFQNLEADMMTMMERAKGIRRFMGCCFGCSSGYRLGKEASEKMAIIDELRRDGNFTSVSHRPPPPRIDSLLPTTDFQDSASTKSLMGQIWEALANGTNYIVGVYGMGGVGKTTLMREVAKHVKNDSLFDVALMVTVTQNPDIKRIQTEMAEQLGLKLREESETVRAAKLVNRMKQMGKILIILDDLWERLEVSDVGIPCGDKYRSCKVVITSRNRNVCVMMESQAYVKVEPLTPQESWNLFSSKAGQVVEHPDLKKVARDVAKECGGLPLAIVTLGRAMRDEYDANTWSTVLKELRQSTPTYIEGMETKVDQCIKRSFDCLRSDEAKLCFLFCSLFPEDYNIQILNFTRYILGEGFLRDADSMEEAQNRVRRLIDRLIDSCLLLEGDRPQHVKMHDVVRDVAIWIASDKTYGFYAKAGRKLTQWPNNWRMEECKRISLMGTNISTLPEQPTCPQLRTLILRHNRRLKFPDGFFQHMEALLVLDPRSTTFSSLPTSFPLVNLRVLFLNNLSKNPSCLSPIGELKKLEILHVESYCFDGLPEELGNLTSLRCLDLTSCKGRIQPNLISKLSRLEQLYLPSVFSNWQVEGSGDTTCAAFAELASLSCLTTLYVDIEDPDCMLQDLSFGPWKALAEFEIRVKSKSLPYRYRIKPFIIRGGRTSLVLTKPISKWVNVLLRKTQCLTLHNWSGMEDLISPEGDIVQTTYRTVEKLRLIRIHDLSRWSTGQLLDGTFGKLNHMVIGECHKLIYILPVYVSVRTHQLREIHVRKCNQLQNVFNLANDLEESQAVTTLLPQLKWINLFHLPELTRIWEGTVLQGSFQNLEQVFVDRCVKLEHVLPPILAVPNELEIFPNLRELVVRKCHNLSHLFSWRQVQGLPNLGVLQVDKCFGMITVIMSEEGATVDEERVFPRLRKVILEDLTVLSSLQQGGPSLLSLKLLEYISVLNCPNLKKLPLSATSSPDLKTFEASEAWFKDLEWEDETVKQRLQALLKVKN